MYGASVFCVVLAMLAVFTMLAVSPVPTLAVSPVATLTMLWQYRQFLRPSLVWQCRLLDLIVGSDAAIAFCVVLPIFNVFKHGR